jgi:hypothetical protein
VKRFVTMSYRRMLVSLTSLLLIPTSSLALDAPASLVPAGVSPGSQFYLIFTTSSPYDATSTDMSDYNRAVNLDAQSPSSLPGVSSLTWKALGATSAVDQCKPFIDLTKPVYTVTKVLVKSTAAAMFSGGATSLSSYPGVQPDGEDSTQDAAWTGCNNTGSPDTGYELGAPNPRFGAPQGTDSAWITTLYGANSYQLKLYAVSPLLTAPITDASGTTPGGPVNAQIVGGGFSGTPQFTTPTAPPSGQSFPYGVFGFTASVPQTNPPSSITVTLTYPQALAAGTKVWKELNGTWLDWTNSVTISGNTITYMITDGGAGDADGAVNGSITDPLGPASPANSIPSLSEWSQMLLGLMVMMLIGWHFHRERSN